MNFRGWFRQCITLVFLGIFPLCVWAGETGFRVTGTYPVPGRAAGSEIVLYFNAPIAYPNDVADYPEPIVSGSIQGRFLYGRDYISFRLNEWMKSGQRVTLTLPETLRAEDGRELDSDSRVHNFYGYEMDLRHVRSVEDEELGKVLLCSFSQPPLWEGLEKFISVTDSKGEPVRFEIIPDDRDIQLKFDPNAKVPFQVNILEGISTRDGSQFLCTPYRFFWPIRDELYLTKAEVIEAMSGRQVIEVSLKQAVDGALLRDALELLDARTREPIPFEVSGGRSSSFQITTSYKLDGRVDFLLLVKEGVIEGDALQVVDEREIPLEANPQRVLITDASFRSSAWWFWDSFPPYAVIQLNYPIAPSVSRAELLEYFEFYPPIEELRIRERSEEETVMFDGIFRARQRYDFRVKSGLPMRGGFALEGDLEGSFSTPEISGNLEFSHKSDLYHMRRGHAPLTVKSSYMESYDLAAYKVFASNIPEVFFADNQYSWSVKTLKDRFFQPAGRLKVSVSGPSERPTVTEVDWAGLVADEQRGIFILEAESGEEEEDRRVRAVKTVMITDLGVLAHWTRDELVVMVHDLEELTPTAGATVRLFSEKRQLLCEGTTGADGLARISYSTDDRGAAVLLIVETPDDYTFLRLEARPVQGAGAGSNLPAYGVSAYEAFLFADRNLIRPGGTLHVGWTVRKGYGDAVPNLPILLRVKKPNGQQLRQVMVQTNDQGNGDWDLETLANDPTGRYLIEALIPGSEAPIGVFTFHMEEFVPDRLRVEAGLSEGENLMRGKAADLVLQGMHLFGAPAADLESEAEAIYTSEIYRDARYPGFSFGNANAAFDTQVQLGRLTTDAEGKALFSIQEPGLEKLTSPLRTVLRGKIFEIGGRFVAAEHRCWFFPEPEMVGLRCTPIEKENAVTVEVAALRTDGLPVETGAVTLELLKVDQFYQIREYMSHHDAKWDRAERLISTESVSLSDGRGMTTFTLEESGGYVIRVRAEGSEIYSSMVVRSAWGEIHVGDGEEPSLLQVSLDQKEYWVGQTARIRIESPFDGLGLLILEGDEIYRVIPFEVKGQVAEVAIDIEPEYYPNVWVGASVVHSFREGRQEVLPFTVYAAQNLSVRNPERELEVTLESLPEVLQPADRFEQAFTVTDASGSPVEGDVLVALVDVGIHQILGWSGPDPLGWLGRPRKASLNLAHYYDRIAYNYTAPAFGGGEGEDRSRNYVGLGNDTWIQPMALWSGIIRTGADGRGLVRFDVPEFTGRGRLQFVALGASGVGSRAVELPIKRPWVMQPHLPRFLVTGDTSVQSLGFFNNSDGPLEFRLRLVSTMDASVLSEEAFAVMVPAGGQDQLTLELKAPEATGLLRQTWAVEVLREDGTQLDRLTREFPIPVEPASRYGSAFETVVVAPGTSVRIGMDSYLDNALAELSVTAAPHPFMRLEGALRFLEEYPYGCVEQTTAQLMGMYLLRSQEYLMRGSLSDRENVDVYFRTGIQKLFSMQNPDGGLAYWPGGRSSHPYGSVFALHFLSLVRADRRISVSGEHVEYLAQYVRELVQDGRLAEPDELYLRAYGCYVLALLGDPQIGEEVERFDDYALSPAGRYLLAATVAKITGQASAAKAYLARVPVRLFQDHASDLTLSSDIRNTAVEFMALYQSGVRGQELNTRLDDLMSFLAGQEMGTTQEFAFVITALSDYFMEMEDQASRAAWAVRDGDGSADFQGAEFFRGTTKGVGAFYEVENTGPTDVFVNVTRRGIAKDVEEVDEENGIAFEREVLNAVGDPVDGERYVQRGAYLVAIKLKVDRPMRHVIVADLIPAGMEITNPVLGGDNALPLATLPQPLRPNMIDMRDDRMVYSYDELWEGEHWFYYGLQAVTPGQYHRPGLIVEAMYDPALRASEAMREVVIEPTGSAGSLE
jgi:uncharacterized protein YfaS (alpha-2-macroglobulin family)